jgi:tight adherence protein B
VTGALAGLAGVTTTAGLICVVVGLRRTDAPPRRRVRTARTQRASGEWDRWRWVVAGLAGLLTWAVSRWPVAGVIVAATVVGLPILLTTSLVAARRIARVEAIEEWTRRLADLLTTGAGLEQALSATARTCPALLRTEVSALLARLAARWPTERALRAFAEEIDDPAGDLVVASLLLAAQRRGPGLASVLTAVAASVAEDVAVRRKIEAERARPRATAKAVTLITFVVIGVGALNGTYLAPYGDPLGQLVLVVIAGGFVGCLVWMRRLTLPAPDARFLIPAGGDR